MSIADQNAYMNATDIEDELEVLDEMNGRIDFARRTEDFLRRNMMAVAAGAFLTGLVVGVACAELRKAERW